MKPRAWNTTLPARTGPMGRGKGLAASLRPASAGKPPPRHAQPAPGGQKPFPRRNARLIDARDVDLLSGERCCQRCAGTQDLERQHRRAKGMGGSENRPHAHCPCNGLVLCRDCHAWAHANPVQAEAEGLIVSQAVDEPGTEGVMRFAAAEGGATQWPSCDGRWLETAPEAREAAA